MVTGQTTGITSRRKALYSGTLKSVADQVFVLFSPALVGGFNLCVVLLSPVLGAV